jgi:hypothetical protein
MVHLFFLVQDNTFPAPKPAAVRLAFLESRGSIVTGGADVKPNLPFTLNSVAKGHDLQARASGTDFCPRRRIAAMAD